MARFPEIKAYLCADSRKQLSFAVMSHMSLTNVSHFKSYPIYNLKVSNPRVIRILNIFLQIEARIQTQFHDFFAFRDILKKELKHSSPKLDETLATYFFGAKIVTYFHIIFVKIPKINVLQCVSKQVLVANNLEGES